MNVITRRAIRSAIGVLAVGALAAALAGPALASHVLVRTTAPSDVTVGEMVNIPVTLQAADGAPLQGTTVTFYLHASFAGVTGETEIGRAVTDENGVAILAYRPRLPAPRASRGVCRARRQRGRSVTRPSTSPALRSSPAPRLASTSRASTWGS